MIERSYSLELDMDKIWEKSNYYRGYLRGRVLEGRDEDSRYFLMDNGAPWCFR